MRKNHGKDCGKCVKTKCNVRKKVKKNIHNEVQTKVKDLYYILQARYEDKEIVNFV